MKILCTGNPKKFTLAWAARQKWKVVDTISLTNGWDLTSAVSINDFRFKISNYDVFINSSYIAVGVQKRLLEITVEEWMKSDIKGHIFNIGTTLEWNDMHGRNDYIQSKIDLRKKSLEFNDKTGITGIRCSYLILGGVNDLRIENRDYVDPNHIMDIIEWIMAVTVRVGMMQIDSPK